MVVSEQVVPRAQRDGIAMRQGDVVYYLHTDHLGSTSLTAGITGAPVAETRYLPYGEERWITGTLVTDFTFTGQRAERGFGLMECAASPKHIVALGIPFDNDVECLCHMDHPF